MVLGPEGVLAAAAPGTVVVIHSTVEPSSIATIAEVAASLKIEVVDAPVSGGEAGAKGKTMSYMVGGSDEDPFEHRQVDLAQERLAMYGLRIERLAGGHLTTSEHPKALATLIADFEAALLPIEPARQPASGKSG